MQAKTLAKKYFGDYFSSRLDQRGEEFLLPHSRQKSLSVLVVDILGLSLRENQASSDDLNSLQQAYFDTIIPPLLRHGGEITSILGDSVICAFGLIEPADHETQACYAAMNIIAGIHALEDNRAEDSIAELRVGIGISSGKVEVGNFGSAERFSFGLRGQQVNLASRLQSLCANYSVPILLDEKTAKSLEPPIEPRRVDSVMVKGIDGSLDLYALD